MQPARFVRLVSLMVAAGLVGLVASPAQAAGTLKLLRVTPAGPNVPPGQEIVFKFDRAMVPLGNMARKPADVPIHITPALHCTWRWLDTDELACRLPDTQRFRPATRYTIRVGTTLKALDGTRLAQPQTHHFTTELPAASWANFRSWRSPVMPVYLMTFNLPVTAAALGRSVAFVPDGGSAGIPARAEPFQKERTGPLLLPVPGVPGAMIWIENPQPVKPEDADKPAYAARKTWLVTPVQPLASATDYTLQLRPGLTTPLGSLPGTGGLSGDTGFVTYGPFRFRGIDCTAADGGKLSYSAGATSPQSRCRPSSVQLLFSAPVPLSTLAAARWTPSPASAKKIAQAWSTYPQWQLGGSRDAYGGIHGHDYALPFDFDPMQGYRVAVPAGVTDQFGRTLAASAAVSFATGHFPPAIDTSAAGGVLEQTQDTVLPVRYTNLDKLDFGYRSLKAAGLQAGAAASAPAGASVSLLASFGGQAPADRHLAVPLGVRNLLAGGSGVVSGTLRWAPQINRWDKGESPVFGEVTPWQAFAKLGHFGTLVWITSLATGAPVADVSVRLYRAFPQELNALQPASIAARTGANGLAVLPGTAVFGSAWTQRGTWSDSKNKHWYLGAVKQNTMALLPLDWSYRRSVGDASDYALYSATAPANGHVRVWALTAQGVYRPGATVHYAAFVRGEGNTALKTAPTLTYTLTITDPTGKKVVKDDNVTLSPFGGLHGDLPIPANAATGWYNIRLAWPVEGRMQTREAGRFLVTDFVPASFKVHTLLAGSLFGPGAAIKAEAQARLHAGGPYTQARVRFNVRLQPEVFAPETPAAAGFSFNANPDNTPSTATLYQNEAHLDQSGNADMHTTLPDKGDIIYGNLVVQSAVESERGTWIANRASALYAARDRFVGLKLHDWLLHAGQAATVQYLVTDAKGTPQADSPVKLMLERQKVTVANVANGSGGFEQQNKTTWVEEAHCQATSKAQPGACKLTPAHAGSYRVVATVTDTQGRTQQSMLGTWAVGPGVVLWKPSAHVTLVPDKKNYHAGDTARVLVQNPYPGARALVTVERYGILWKKVVTLKGSTPVLEVPIKPDFFPGAYLSVAIFSPRVAKPAKKADLGKPTLALGYVALPVTGTGSSLAVTVKPAHAEYKPRQNVDVQVAVKNTAGKPAAHTRLVAAVVDEAVLDLLQGGAGYYDPRKAFYAPPDGPDVLNYSLLSKLGTTHYIKVTGSAVQMKKGVTPGGGGGSALSIRSIFKYTADWQPALE
ncbi:MAG: MG2 domain-containing protein, partial [Gammaproteobacteria bacterium]